jgi:hypothetical protein
VPLVPAIGIPATSVDAPCCNVAAKAHDLITNPAFIVMKAADEFKDKTTAPIRMHRRSGELAA